VTLYTLARVYAGQALCSCEILYPHISLFDAKIQKTTIQMLRPVEDIRAGCYKCFRTYSAYCARYFYSYYCRRWILHSWEKWFIVVSFLVAVDGW